jgi:hypothetical protein
MRCKFKLAGYFSRLQAGELKAVLLEEGHPAPEKSGQPFCTRSQQLSYRDSNNSEVARVHQYLRPDQTIGASGKPDPLRLIYRGAMYRLKKGAKDPHPSPSSAFGRAWNQLQRLGMRLWGPIRCWLYER